MLDLLLDLREHFGLSVVFISHDLAVVHYLCDRVIVMRDGEIVEQGASEQVFHEPESGYARMLISSLPRLGQ